MAALAIPNLDQLKQMSARFAPVNLKHDESNLSAVNHRLVRNQPMRRAES